MSRVRTYVVTSLQWIPSPCLNANKKPKININCSVLHILLYFTSTAVCFVCFTSSEHKKKLANDMHSQKTVLHINCRLSCLRLTSTAVFHKTAVLHINCRLFVCLNLVEIKHMPKTQIKLFHAGLKIPCKNVQTFPNLHYKSRKHLQHTCPPLKLCAVRRQDMPQKKNFRSVCLHEFLWKFMLQLPEKSCCSACGSHSR